MTGDDLPHPAIILRPERIMGVGKRRERGPEERLFSADQMRAYREAEKKRADALQAERDEWERKAGVYMDERDKQHERADALGAELRKALAAMERHRYLTRPIFETDLAISDLRALLEKPHD